MSIRKLQLILHGLSAKQKSNFTRYAGKKPTLRRRLYNELLESGLLAVGEANNFGFTSVSVLRNTKNDLFNAVIGSVALYEYGDNSLRSEVYAAIQLTAYEWANARLRRALCECFNEGRLTTAMYIWDFLRELEVFWSFASDLRTKPIKVSGNQRNEREFNLTPELLGQEIEVYRRLIDALTDFRSLSNVAKSIRVSQVRRYKKLLFTEYNAPINQDLVEIAKVRYYYFLEQMDLALKIGMSVVARMLENQSRYPVQALGREIRFVSILALESGYRDLSLKMYFNFSRINKRNVQDDKVLTLSAISVGAAVAANFGDKEIAISCYEQLQSLNNPVDEIIIAINYYNLGRAFFWLEMYGHVKTCLIKARNYFPSNYPTFRWEPQAMLSIAYFHLGEPDMAHYMLRSAQNASRSFDESFPRTAVHLIRRFLKCDKSVVPFTRLDLINIEMLISDQIEKRATKDFPIQIWIESQIHSVAPFEILKQKSNQRFFEIDLGMGEEAS